MNRVSTKVRISETIVRYRTKITGEECTAGSHEARYLQHRMIQTLADTTSLLSCGPAIFEKLLMTHVDGHWVVELEACVEEPE